MFEDPLPAVVDFDDPGTESPAWAIRKMSDAVSPATTRSDTTTEGVRGSLKMIAAGVVGGKMIMSARLSSAGPRHSPIFHDSLCPKGPPRARSTPMATGAVATLHKSSQVANPRSAFCIEQRTAAKPKKRKCVFLVCFCCSPGLRRLG